MNSARMRFFSFFFLSKRDSALLLKLLGSKENGLDVEKAWLMAHTEIVLQPASFHMRTWNPAWIPASFIDCSSWDYTWTGRAAAWLRIPIIFGGCGVEIKVC